jgi:hypothetical protein
MDTVRVSFPLVKYFANAKPDSARSSVVVVSAKTDRYSFCYIPYSSRGLFGAIERDGDYGSSAVLKSPRDQPC